MKTNPRRKIVGGIEFEAVRFQVPCLHWRIKVVKTGEVYESGVFSGMGSLENLWYSVEKTARCRGSSWLSDHGISPESMDVGPLPIEHLKEYDNAAEWCARRGYSGAIGSMLPVNMDANGALVWINADPEAFQKRVREFAYGLAMEHVKAA